MGRGRRWGFESSGRWGGGGGGGSSARGRRRWDSARLGNGRSAPGSGGSGASGRLRGRLEARPGAGRGQRPTRCVDDPCGITYPASAFYGPNILYPDQTAFELMPKQYDMAAFVPTGSFASPQDHQKLIGDWGAFFDVNGNDWRMMGDPQIAQDFVPIDSGRNDRSQGDFPSAVGPRVWTSSNAARPRPRGPKSTPGATAKATPAAGTESLPGTRAGWQLTGTLTAPTSRRSRPRLIDRGKRWRRIVRRKNGGICRGS